ncbi:MAG: PfkB family carbohydrate kinase [Candidatus Gracilibacteria bacterium]|nr:PfkB family carbohydrate kinase [Candidatus Gracilibacteria bacterium]
MSKVLVIGDVMLDKFSYGEVKRLNPEGPNPLLNIIKEDFKLGGAANVAANISSLNGNCDLLGTIGNDLNGETFKNLLKENNINFFNLNSNFKTITKQRFIENTYNQQMLRVDYEEKINLGKNDIEKIINQIKSNNYEIIIISDYNKGVFNEELFKQIQIISKDKNIKILIDSKPNHYSFIEDVFLLKPNFKEFSEIIGVNIDNTDENIENYGLNLAKNKKSNLVITRGSNGASLIELNGKITHLKTEARQVYDVTGAGDTFISAIASGLLTGYSLENSIILGNKASGIVVGKLGTEKVTKKELFN